MAETNTWEALLFLGRANQLTSNYGSERMIRRALELAERSFGPESPEVGLCLLDLADCLEKAGKLSEADSLTERYRGIIRLHFRNSLSE